MLKDIGGVELPESLIKLGTEGGNPSAKPPESNGNTEKAAAGPLDGGRPRG